MGFCESLAYYRRSLSYLFTKYGTKETVCRKSDMILQEGGRNLAVGVVLLAHHGDASPACTWVACTVPVRLDRLDRVANVLWAFALM